MVADIIDWLKFGMVCTLKRYHSVLNYIMNVEKGSSLLQVTYAHAEKNNSKKRNLIEIQISLLLQVNL